MVKITVDRIRRTVLCQVTGALTLADMRQAMEESKRATDQLGGREHIVVADLRGLAPMSPEVAAGFGEIIKYGRERGTIKCVHLSDSSIARLQAARLAREASPGDDVTVNVVSMEEAERVVDEYQKRFADSVRPRR